MAQIDQFVSSMIIANAIIAFHQSLAFANFEIKTLAFVIHDDKVCSAVVNRENTESHSVHECSVKCMTGADCVGFTYQDGRCSFVSAVEDLTMSVQTGAKCVLNDNLPGTSLIFNAC